MKKIAMTKNAYNALALRVTTIVAATLLVLLPATGFGSFASVANATEASTVTSLSTFTIDGQAVTDGATVSAPYGTDSVEVVATPTAAADGATVDITGDTDLVTGPNTVTAVVTAEDDVTTQTYTVTVNVAENDDTTLGVFAVNGNDVTNGATVELPFGTTEVEYVAEASDIEAAVVVDLVDDLVTGPNTMTVTVTAANGTATATYTVTLNVAENDDTTLGVFAIDGADVVSGATIDLPFGTTEVEYVAEASDVDAAVVVDLVEDLVTGPNTLTVTVTAANGTSTATYTVTLNVLENDDATLGVFAINGTDVESGATVNLPFGTTEVEYVAEATDPEAGVVVSVVEDLVPGANTLTVTVTAANGTTTATYTVTLNVQANDDATLGVFSVNGDDVVDGGSVNLANGVTSVTVVAEPSDTAATAVVTGATGLITGTNTLTVVVTAADGTTKATYTVSLVVANLDGQFSNDTSLSTFKIDGKNVVDGGSLNVGLGRSSVTVEVVPTNAYATAIAAGNTNLVLGSNTVTVTVTADDGTIKVYTVTVVVAAPSSVKTVASVTVNGSDFTTGFNAAEALELPFGTTQVTVSVVPTSNLATVAITNNTGLTTGANNVNVTVTAEDGTTADYTVKLNVLAANANTALSALTVNGTSLLTASSLDLPFGTTAVSVEATTEAGTSTFTVTGNSNLTAGSNTLTIRVTAQSGATQDIVKTLNVLSASSDKAITGITVNGNVVEGAAITLATGVTSATVLATLSSPFASYAVTGASSLNPGANTVTITVTAQDGTTAATEITVTVAQPSTVNTLSSITVDGATVVAGDTVNKAFGTTSVAVVATPTSNLATAVVTGDTGLVSGLNTVTISVTAESGAVANYTLTVNVAKSSDKTLASITANGQTVAAGGTVNLASGTTSINVVALATSPDATVAVSGNTGLVAGANTVTVTVTAGDLTTQAYTFTANVLTLSEDTSLAVFTINGQDALTNSTINVGNEVTEAFVLAQTTSSAATFTTLTATLLPNPGTYNLQFRVTAENTAFTRLIEITVIRAAALSDNANLGTITVNGTATTAGSTVNVTPGTTSVTVVATAEDAGASTTVEGATDLKTGNNTVTVFVTAANSRVASYTFTVNVPASNNTNLTGITVNGQSVALNDLVFNVPAITTSVVVAATTEYVDATFAVTGEDALVTGDNEVVITVTAADGTTTREYKLNVVRAAVSSNTALGTITLNGATVADGATVNVPFGTTEVFVTATGADVEATTEVTGTTELVTGTNEITIVVTAPSGATATYTVNVNVLALSSDTSLAVFTADGVAVVDGGVLNLDGINNFVAVVAQATSPAATVEITGSADIPVGESEIVVVVTAEDGTTATYTLTVNLRDRTIATLSTFTVNGVEVIDGETVEFPSGTEDAEIVALPTDEEALVEIEGGSGLEPGENVVTITVTAVDEVTVEVYTVILDVAFSADTSLSEFTANGEVVEDGSEIELPANTTEIEIVAVPTDENANVEIIGADALVPGDNTIEVIVTAPNGDTLIYSLFVLVVLSADNSVSDITVGGESVQDGDVVLTTDLEITEIDVEVTTNDENATVEITGNTELVLGDNLITIVVTAANFESREIKVTFRIGGLPGNSRLESLNVGGVKLNLEEAPFSVNLPAGTKTAPVIAFAVDDSSKIKVEGNKNLVAGANTVTITVTAADNITVRTYTVTVNVAALSSNSNITSLKVNGTSVADGATFQLPAGSGFADCVAVPEDSGSTVTYTGNKNLVTGNNPVVVKVTAADGSHTNYTMTLVVPALSSDKSLSTFTIQGFNVLGKSKINVLPGTTKLKVTAIAAAAGSSVTIVGRDIQPGLNDVVVTVTAADGTSQTYTVRVKA
jgi:hypothetical protein